MMRIILLFVLLHLASGANACLNIFGIDSSGRLQMLEHFFFASIEFRQEKIESNLKALQKKFNKNEYSYQNISDYGAYLLMSGQFAQGLDIFRALQKKHAGVYEIMANTAVAYELNGKIDSALICQRAAMQLNPQAHNKSEWIHLKILEARKKMLSDPNWCLQNEVTGVADSIKKFSSQDKNLMGYSYRTYVQFTDQLAERLPFTRAEDKVMGKLMFELGDAYLFGSIHRAYYCYALAKYLYPALAATADAKMAAIKKRYASSAQQTPQVGSNAPDAKKELRAPRDEEVDRFVTRMIRRPALQSKKITTVSIEQLIAKI